MADHLDEPPQKKAKKDPFQGPSDASSEYPSAWISRNFNTKRLTMLICDLFVREVQVQSLTCFVQFVVLDLYSSGPNFDEMLLLETELPDELMQGGSSSWDQQMVSNKPPAQGPGPGQQQMYSNQLNGSDDAISSNVNLQRQQQQQQQHQLAHLLQQVKSKNSLNTHMGQLSNKSPNLQGNNATVMNNLGGVVSMPMSMAPNNNGTNNNAMSMQGKI